MLSHIRRAAQFITLSSTFPQRCPGSLGTRWKQCLTSNQPHMYALGNHETLSWTWHPPTSPCNGLHSFLRGRHLCPGYAGERLFIKGIDNRGDQSLAVVPYLLGIIIQEWSCPSVCSSPPLNYIQSLHGECSPCARSQMLSLQAFSYKLMLKPEWLMRLAKQLYLWPDCIKLALSI